MSRIAPTVLPAVLLVAAAAHAQSFTNGDFATSAAGWSLVTGPGSACVSPLWQAFTGNPPGCVLLNACGEYDSDPTASQTVTGLVAGHVYTVQVDVMLYAATAGGGTGKSFGIYLDSEPGNPIYLGEFLDASWHTVAATFTAPASGSATIIFAAEVDRRTPGGPSIDTDISYYIDNAVLIASACMSPPAGLIGWWPMDTVSDFTVAELTRDDNGHAFGLPKVVAGKVSGAMEFPTSDDFVEASALANVGPGDYSVDAWVRSGIAADPVRTILDKRGGPDGLRGYSLYMSHGHLGCQMADGATYDNFGSLSPVLWDGSWHLVAMTVQRTSTTGGKLYVDGNVVLTFDPTLHPGSLDNTGALRIGQAFDGSSVAFAGDIDEVEVYKRALRATEIESLFTADTSGKCRSQVVAPARAVAQSDWFHDTFPTNDDDSFVGSPAFDTLGAQVRTGRNTEPVAVAGQCRPDIPGDSVVVAVPGPNVRVDLVFRILPGPGNYVGMPQSNANVPTGVQKIGQLKRRPDQAAQATASDGSFWGSYLADVGLFGTNGPHTSATTMSAAGGYGVAANAWDPNIWVSARCDTAELNLFPCQAVGANVSALSSGLYQTTLHEDEIDPTLVRSAAPLFGGGRAALGIQKNRCILISTLTGDPVDETNIDCGAGTVPPSGTSYATAWATKYVPNIGGYTDPTCPACPVGQTKEYTKIIPDGQLTAGSHVEYFIRRTTVGNVVAFTMVPDTNRVTPQPEEGSLDAHRWQEFSVLPDFWKDTNYGGEGMACMLFVDLDDSHGDEAIWDVSATLLGLTSGVKNGSHNGWKVSAWWANPNSPSGFVPVHYGQAGLRWDMFGVRGVDYQTDGYAGSIGSRLACQPTGVATGKGSRLGPTDLMLRYYYRIVYAVSGSLYDHILGPYPSDKSVRSQDDVSILTSFLQTPTGSTQPRGLYVEGSGFAESESAHPSFLTNVVGASLTSPSYSAPTSCIDLVGVSTGGGPYGLESGGSISDDVLAPTTAIGAVDAAEYVPLGGSPPGPVASIDKPATSYNWITHLDGWDPMTMHSQYCLSDGARAVYQYNVLTGTFGGFGCIAPLSLPADVGPRPPAPVSDALWLSNNPRRTGAVGVHFSLPTTKWVSIRLYDIGGRRVRTLVERNFIAGVHDLAWDGLDDHSQSLPAGVYFARLQSRPGGYQPAKKLILLR